MGDPCAAPRVPWGGRLAPVRLVALACVAALWLPASAVEDAVVTLTKDNFDDALKKTKRLLVEFYAPWCGHCKSLEPEYKRAAEEMEEEKLETVLAKVDATAEGDLAQRYGVSGYPTLIYLVQGQEPKTYEGGRTASAIKSWLRKREVPPFEVISEDKAEEFLKEVKEGEFGVVARVAEKSARAKAFLAALEGSLADYEAMTLKFAVVYLPKTAGPKSDASMTMARPGFEEPDAVRLTYDQKKWTDAGISTWVRTSTYPLVGRTFKGARYSASAAEALGRDGSVVVLMEDSGLRQTLLPELLKLAQAQPRWLVTAVAASDLKEHELQELGAKPGTKSMATVLQGQKKYVLTGGDEAIAAPGAVAGLLDSVRAKKARPFYKTAPAPAQAVDAEGVTVLVGETFEKHVLDSKKDVFVEFYAPWCGHCKKLTPIWAELAKKAQAAGWSKKGLVVAKMDATENECDEEVTGFPKLVLYPAGNKKFKQKQVYNGARELDPLVDFLLENAKNLEGLEDAKPSGKGKKYSMADRERERKGRRGAKSQEL